MVGVDGRNFVKEEGFSMIASTYKKEAIPHCTSEENYCSWD
jgi:hypothetical protein